MEFIKRHLALFLAFGLPVALICIVALTIYLPSLFLSTSYNFVYSACAEGNGYYSYGCEGYLRARYQVVDGKLVLNSVDANKDLNGNGILDVNEKIGDRIFLHDTKKNESREITAVEAQGLNLNGLLTSPDGVTVSSHYSGGGDFFPFGGGYSSYGQYLVKGKSKSKLNLINNSEQYYYRNNFQFLGWVLPGRN